MDINKEGTELKIKRASHLPVSVPRTATDVLVKRKAVEKHMAHNKDLHTESLESDMQWILLYPDLDVVLYIPGTKVCFSIAKYKESIGKPYNRVNLYLCRKRDYEGNHTPLAKLTPIHVFLTPSHHYDTDIPTLA